MRAPGSWFRFDDPAVDVFERVAAQGKIIGDEAASRQGRAGTRA